MGINWDKLKEDIGKLKEISKEIEDQDPEVVKKSRVRGCNFLEPDEIESFTKDKIAEEVEFHFVVKVDERQRIFSYLTPEKVKGLLEDEGELGEFLKSLVKNAEETTQDD